MGNALSRPRGNARFLRRIGAVLGTAALSLTTLTVQAQDESASTPVLHPFEAKYRLELRGWPGATITHTLSEQSAHWMSDMQFSVAVAGGEERSRFSINNGTFHSLLYNSSYSLLGVGDSYQLNEEDISSLDRQTALVALSSEAGSGQCTQAAPCPFEFVDHRGRPENFMYYDAPDVSTISVPAGEFPTHQVFLVDSEKPDRTLQINFHPDWPGLILFAEYKKEGKRQTRIAMTQFTPEGGAER